MRVYVPAAAGDLRRLETDGRLPDDDRLRAFAVTPWVVDELGAVEAEDEMAEYAVLSAAVESSVDGEAPVAVLVFDLPVADLPSDGVEVTPGRDLLRRRLVAVHLAPDLDWYAGHELPDVIATWD